MFYRLSRLLRLILVTIKLTLEVWLLFYESILRLWIFLVLYDLSNQVTHWSQTAYSR